MEATDRLPPKAVFTNEISMHRLLLALPILLATPLTFRTTACMSFSALCACPASGQTLLSVTSHTQVHPLNSLANTPPSQPRLPDLASMSSHIGSFLLGTSIILLPGQVLAPLGML